MELLTSRLPKSHTILLAGDLHRGSVASHRKGWRDLLDRVAEEPRTYLVLMGDLLEAITVDDPRFHAEVHDSRALPFDLVDDVVSDLAPLKKKIVAVLTGNHEQKLYRWGDMTRQICQRAGVPYGGYSCKISIRSSDKGPALYKVFVTHGRLSVNSTADDPVRRQSNMRLSVKRRLQHLAGDCAVMATGHCHRLLTVSPVPELYMSDNGKHLQAAYTQGVQHDSYIAPEHRWYAATGSFLKSAVVGATTYSEAAMYAPVELGYVELRCEDGRLDGLHEVHLGADHDAL